MLDSYLEAHLSNAGYCLADEHFYSTLDKASDFNQCFLDDEVRNKEITRALSQVEAEDQFAFYNLDFSQRERELLRNIEIEEFNDVTINTSTNKLKELKHEVSLELRKMHGVKILELDGLSNLITRLVSVVEGELEAEEYELKIRSRESYHSEEDCMYWHLDKSEEEILGNSDNGKEKRFIMILKGEGTAYHDINEEQRMIFMKTAEEAPYYYGHGLEGCKANDEINQIFKNQEAVATQERYGSVHIAGSNGAMHAAPKDSESRLILLLTPKTN